MIFISLYMWNIRDRMVHFGWRGCWLEYKQLMPSVTISPQVRYPPQCQTDVSCMDGLLKPPLHLTHPPENCWKYDRWPLKYDLRKQCTCADRNIHRFVYSTFVLAAKMVRRKNLPRVRRNICHLYVTETKTKKQEAIFFSAKFHI